MDRVANTTGNYKENIHRDKTLCTDPDAETPLGRGITKRAQSIQ